MKRLLTILSLVLFASAAVFAASAETILTTVFGERPAVSGGVYEIDLPRSDLGATTKLTFKQKYDNLYNITGDVIVTKSEEHPVRMNIANTVGFSNVAIATSGDLVHITFLANGDLSHMANVIQMILFYDTRTPFPGKR